jgi:hypothetical protein
VTDEGAGVGCDGVEVFFAGVPLLTELDDETGDVIAYAPGSEATPWEATLRVVAVDRCGNRSERERLLEWKRP